jgi:signal transduction histidine kinase
MRLGRAHGGKLWLESNIDQGSTFYLTLPIRSQVLMQLLEEGHDV